MAEVDFKTIVDRLQDDAEYYGDYGGQFLHNSDIYTLLNNPQDYGKKQSDTLPMLLGRAFHEMLLFNNHSQPYIDASTRNTKIYKSELEDYDEEIVMLKKEYEQLSELKRAAQEHPVISDVLSTKGIKKEVPSAGYLTDNEIIWACKADIVTDDYIYDVKTTSSLSGFRHSSKTYNYDSQAYIYSTMFQKPMRFLVVEKGTGCIGLFDTSEEAYLRGREKVEQAEELYIKYFRDKKDDVLNHYTHGTI